MRLRTVVWGAILAACIAGTVYEAPSIVRNLRYLRNTHTSIWGYDTRVLPKKLVAADPEAGDILQYHLDNEQYGPDTRNLPRLKDLVARYPKSEYLLSKLAQGWAKVHPREGQEALALADTLLLLDPNNAHYRYLRGWVLLTTEDGEHCVPEALEEFELGHRLPKFHLPFARYKERLVMLAEIAALDPLHRPEDETFYPELGRIVRNAAGWENLDRDSFLELVASATQIADRVIGHARDVDSLVGGAEMMEKIEQMRLRKLPLSQAEAQQTRWRLSQTIAISDLRQCWDDDIWLADASFGPLLPWLVLMLLPICFVRRWDLANRIRDGKTDAKRESPPDAGMWIAIALAAFMVVYEPGPSEGWKLSLMDIAWFVIAVMWPDYAYTTACLDADNQTLPRPSGRRPMTAIGLLYVNGAFPLLITNTGFLWSGTLAGWPRAFGALFVWFVCCLLLWAATCDREPVFGKISHHLTFSIVLGWVGILLLFEVFGAKWHYENQAYAEPLSLYGPIPAATQETYERVILNAEPPDYGTARDPHPLPDHTGVLAPEDMIAFLGRREAEGKPLNKEQLRDLLRDSGRDVHPILREAIERLNAEPPPVQIGPL